MKVRFPFLLLLVLVGCVPVYYAPARVSISGPSKACGSWWVFTTYCSVDKIQIKPGESARITVQVDSDRQQSGRVPPGQTLGRFYLSADADYEGLELDGKGSIEYNSFATLTIKASGSALPGLYRVVVRVSGGHTESRNFPVEVLPPDPPKP